MRKIIIATDYSPEASNATAYAASLAAKRGYELILFTLYNPSIHALNARSSGALLDGLMTENQNKLNETASEIENSHKVTVTPYFATGDFFEEIKRCIETTEADMLVMGMAQKSIEQDLLGNTTTTAIHRLQIPILSIPLEVKYEDIKHILFAYDAAHGVPEQALERVHTLAEGYGATVEIFNVKDKAGEIENKTEDTTVIDEMMDDIAYYYKNVESTEVIKAIKQETIDTKTDLLVMVPQQYGFWSSIVHRSKTRMMASGNNILLLSIPM